MSSPPEGVVTVMEAVCIMLEEKPEWDTAKKVMSNVNFLKMLKEYKKDEIHPRIIRRLQKYMRMPKFTETDMRSVSVAAASLCAWVRAIVVYSQVAKEVEPKKKRVEETKVLVAEARSKLQHKRNQLAKVVANVRALEQRRDQTIQRRDNLNDQLKETRLRLENAAKLTSGLGEEYERWKADADVLKVRMEKLVGDAFLSAGCVSYLGPFTGHYRDLLVQRWVKSVKARGIPVSEDFSLLATLGDPVAIRDWHINGLPTDNVSIDSAIMAFTGQRYPLLIDPQNQAKKWIKNEHRGQLLITHMDDPNLLRTVETGIRNGKVVIVEDVGEEISGSLDPVLLDQTTKQHNRTLIQLGENEIDVDPDFRFYMTTQLPNPHYLPEVCIKVNLLNFTVTPVGLTDQLLGLVVRKEMPEVEEKKDRLVVSMAQDRRQLQDIERKILRMLSESKGNVLDDVELISALGDSKFTSNMIKNRMKEALETQETISRIRDKYVPVAKRGSILYFSIADLALIDPMYQYSLAYFSRLFALCIDKTEKDEDLGRRLSNLLDTITFTTYTNVCRGLFEEHKLLFSFVIAVEILRAEKKVSQAEWSLMLRGGSRVDMTQQPPNPVPELLDPLDWQLVCALEENVSAFCNLKEDITANKESWRVFATAEKAHEAPLPGSWDAELSPFQRLLLLKAFRSELLVFGFAQFVAQNLGARFTRPPQVQLADVFGDCDCKTPVIFVLSAGADPTSMLLRFAKQQGQSNSLQVISLGQGQGDNAARMIAAARRDGSWVLLQNCHLAKSWMPSLEKLVLSFSDPSTSDVEEEKVNPGFRLWLTSMPCTYFPVSVLQNGVKVTNEPPKGLQANLRRSYKNVVREDEFENSPKLREWKKLMFGLCFFHATIQERKRFGPLGWNKMYEFNDSDLETSIQVLTMFLAEQPEVPWDALRYVIGEINYGGRVTDDWDRRCLMSILHRFFLPDILKDQYQFSGSGVYHAPKEGAFRSYVEYIEGLPKNDPPEIFGMHENANITFQRQETVKILATTLGIQPREVEAAGGKTSDDVVAETAADIERGLPDLLTRAGAAATTFVEKEGGVLDSLATVLLQEMERFNRLLTRMKQSLQELQRAIRGEVLMSPELDQMYTSLLNNQVPALWAEVAYPSLKVLVAWVEDLHRRIAFMSSWIKEGPPNSFWLSGFFFPQGFMTGTLQNFARKYQVPIDSLGFSFTVLDSMDPEELKEPPEDGVYIHGLFMDGARWDRDKKVIMCAELGEIYSRVPIIHFKPAVQHRKNPSDYECPVYKTSVRAGVLSTTGQSTNFILAVELPSLEQPDFWVLQGAALLCSLPST